MESGLIVETFLKYNKKCDKYSLELDVGLGLVAGH